jgi:histidyl-tRNA synthetase
MLELYERAHRLARLYGYRYLETPVLERTELFARTAGETSDVVTKEMYTFETASGRSMTLRPESTASMVRAYLAHEQDLSTPFKGYYLGSQFRHDRPQAGRLREFRQFGAEVLGAAAPGADVEVIALQERFLRDLGLGEVELHLNSIGDAVCRPAYRELLIAYLEPFETALDEDCRARLRTNPLRVLDCKVDGSKDFVLAAPVIADHLCDACAEHLAAVQEGLRDEGIDFVRDPRLVRGLDYYTRTAFEFIGGSLTISAGGRYDGLAEVIGGRDVPGVGFAMGLDRVLLALEDLGDGTVAARGPRCFVVSIGDRASAAETGAALLRELRQAGVSAASAFEDRPLKAQLRMADHAGAAFVAIMGDRERTEGVVTLRRLVDGIQKSVPRAEVASWLIRLADEPENDGPVSHDGKDDGNPP